MFFYNMCVALSNEEYRSICKKICKRFKNLHFYPELEYYETNNICKRLITFKNELFVFLKFRCKSHE